MSNCICECHGIRHVPRPCPYCAWDCLPGQLWPEERVSLVDLMASLRSPTWPDTDECASQ